MHVGRQVWLDHKHCNASVLCLYILFILQKDLKICTKQCSHYMIIIQKVVLFPYSLWSFSSYTCKDHVYPLSYSFASGTHIELCIPRDSLSFCQGIFFFCALSHIISNCSQQELYLWLISVKLGVYIYQLKIQWLLLQKYFLYEVPLSLWRTFYRSEWESNIVLTERKTKTNKKS